MRTQSLPAPIYFAVNWIYRVHLLANQSGFGNLIMSSSDIFISGGWMCVLQFFLVKQINTYFFTSRCSQCKKKFF